MILAGRSQNQKSILHIDPNTNLWLLNINNREETKSFTTLMKIWSPGADNKLESVSNVPSASFRKYPTKTTLKGYLNTVGPLICYESSFWLCRLSLIFDIVEDHTPWRWHLTSPFDIFHTQSDCVIVVYYIWKPFLSGICCLRRATSGSCQFHHQIHESLVHLAFIR